MKIEQPNGKFEDLFEKHFGARAYPDDEQHICYHCGCEMSRNPRLDHKYPPYYIYAAVDKEGNEWVCIPCLILQGGQLTQRVSAAMEALDQITCILRKDGYLA